MPTLHDHDHSHGRESARSGNRRRLALVLALSAAYMVAEFVGGLWTNSLALLADAGHMLSDVAALALSFFAVWIAERPAGPRQTYGYYRAEILAALVNGAALVAISAFILLEAWRRLRDPSEVVGPLMTGVAAGGLVVNLAGLWILHGGREASLNVRGAWLHVLADMLGSVGAIAAGVLIWAFRWHWADPAASIAIALLIVYSSWRLLAESVSVLMECAPRGIDVDEVRNAMAAVEGVLGVHDLHVWTITSGLESLSAHVVVEPERRQDAVLTEMRAMLHEKFGIDHITLQIEPPDFEERAVPV
ncbi:MAG: cation diffusion facilitator family transporter [Planctomycetes bacterium]|nr:cation diffusion facilitator family transporter [Planctomycetota bacterium]